MSYEDFMALPDDERRLIFDSLVKIYIFEHKRLSGIAADILKKIKELS